MIASASTFRVGQGLIRRGANIDFHSRFHLSVPLRHPGAVPHLFSISFVSIPTSRRPRRTLHLQTSDGGVRGGAETFSFCFYFFFAQEDGGDWRRTERRRRTSGWERRGGSEGEAGGGGRGKPRRDGAGSRGREGGIEGGMEWGRCDYLSGVRVCVTEEEAH